MSALCPPLDDIAIDPVVTSVEKSVDLLTAFEGHLCLLNEQAVVTFVCESNPELVSSFDLLGANAKSGATSAGVRAAAVDTLVLHGLTEVLSRYITLNRPFVY